MLDFKMRYAIFACHLLAATSFADFPPNQFAAKDEILSYKGLDRPFRMNKVNLLWEKARLKLTEGKLKSLYSELKMQDKQELTLKRVRAEQGDKDGAMEAEVRKAFTGIMNTYGLAGASKADGDDLSKSGQKLHHVMFKDKKLNRLWEKAEKAGLTEEERQSLKQEFIHHQEKMDEYHKLLDMADVMGRDGNAQSNHIHPSDDDEEFHKRSDNALDGLAKEVKADYDRLHRIATNANPKEFEDEVARSLWKLAKEADFTPEELDSLRDELHHFQARRAKMHYLEAELSMVDKRHGGEFANEEENKTQGRKIMDKKLRKHVELVEKAQRDFERRIASRHSEL